MSGYPDIYVLRHGETEWNRAGRHQGQLDSPLTDRGAEQAASQGVVLKEIIGAEPGDLRAYVSPSGRARATADIALRPLGMLASVDDRLLEVDFGLWHGLTRDEIDARWPDTTADQPHMFDWHFRSEGGEDFAALKARTEAFLGDLTAPAILITHGITSRVLRGLWLGLSYEDMKEVGGGQGCVYHLTGGVQRRLTD